MDIRKPTQTTRRAAARRTIISLSCVIAPLLAFGCLDSHSPNPAEPKCNRETTKVRTAPKPYLQAARGRLEAFRIEHNCPGATLGFVLPDGRTGSVAVGVSRKNYPRPMEPTDRMFSGSIGKTYVAALALKLVEEGQLDLDSKVSSWFPDEEWFGRLPNADRITLRMLMNHTSGIPRHIMTPAFKDALREHPQKVWRPEELLAFVFDAQPLFPAGQSWSYADTNYILVGMIIERVTGRTYYEEVTDRILIPYNFSDTSPADRPDLARLVSGYTSEENLFSLPTEVAVNGRYAINPQVEWTGGGLISTASDLARWAHALYSGNVLEQDSMRQMLQGVPTQALRSEEYGLAVFKRHTDLGPVVGHGGWVPGYVSLMAYYVDHNLAVAFQINTDVGLGREVLRSLLDRVAADLTSPTLASAGELGTPPVTPPQPIGVNLKSQ